MCIRDSCYWHLHLHLQWTLQWQCHLGHFKKLRLIDWTASAYNIRWSTWCGGYQLPMTADQAINKLRWKSTCSYVQWVDITAIMTWGISVMTVGLGCRRNRSGSARKQQCSRHRLKLEAPTNTTMTSWEELLSVWEWKLAIGSNYQMDRGCNATDYQKKTIQERHRTAK